MNTKSDKNHFQKHIKLSKNFWINPYIVEHTHITFNQVQSNK